MNKIAHFVFRALRRILGRVTTGYYTLIARVRFWINQAEVGKHLNVSGPLVINICYSGRVQIGHHCRINSGFYRNPVGNFMRTTIWIGRNGRLEIGNRVGISNSTIVCMEHVKIEDNVFIGGGCKIYDTDFHPLLVDDRVHNLSAPQMAPIVIKRGSFIGGHSIVLKGVTIGENAVIGAGSVVTKDVPAREIWAGNPARFIRKLGG